MGLFSILTTSKYVLMPWLSLKFKYWYFLIFTLFSHLAIRWGQVKWENRVNIRNRTVPSWCPKFIFSIKSGSAWLGRPSAWSCHGSGMMQASQLISPTGRATNCCCKVICPCFSLWSSLENPLDMRSFWREADGSKKNWKKNMKNLTQGLHKITRRDLAQLYLRKTRLLKGETGAKTPWARHLTLTDWLRYLDSGNMHLSILLCLFNSS